MTSTFPSTSCFFRRVHVVFRHYLHSLSNCINSNRVRAINYPNDGLLDGIFVPPGSSQRFSSAKWLQAGTSWLCANTAFFYLKGYALCRRPLLASRDCHLGALVPPFWHSGTPSGSTLGDHLGTSGAPGGAILAPRDHPGRTWEQQDGREGANIRIFVDFGVISGLVCVSLCNSRCFKICFFCWLASRSFFIDFWLESFTLGTPKSLFSHRRYCKNRFSWKLFFGETRDRFFLFLRCLGSRLSDLLGLENKLENETIFSEKLDPHNWIWWRRSWGIWAL